MIEIKADGNAFHAYRVLFFPVFGRGGLIPEIPDGQPSEEAATLALTAADNIKSTPYRISGQDTARLALAYHALIGTGHADSLPDLFAAVRGFSPDLAGVVPMYPGFPSQVIDMDEASFRLDQVLHYFSTYGVEMLFGVEVSRGWLPEGEMGTEPDEDILGGQLLRVFLSSEEMHAFMEQELARPARLSPQACELAAQMAALYPERKLSIAFHENALAIVRLADAKHGSRELSDAVSAVSVHPGDVLKIACDLLGDRDRKPKRHLATYQKKALCRALEAFETAKIARNIADLGPTGKAAITALSVARFGGKKLGEAVSLVESGKVRSWNAELEALWTTHNAGRTAETSKALLAKYGERPGLLLRSLTRLMLGGVDPALLGEELEEHIDAYSAVTLTRLLAIASRPLDDTAYILRGFSYGDMAAEPVKEDDKQVERRLALHFLSSTIHQMLLAKMEKLDTPIRGKKVFLDAGPFSLKGSVVLPNSTGNTGDSYPPAGMAYELPEDKTVRFFVFWDHPRNRVDVDAHFYAFQNGMEREEPIHVGWNGDYEKMGMVTSGDITHSDNAVEYMDLDLAIAKLNKIDYALFALHIYSGPSDWRDIETCFCGSLIVGDKEIGTAIYKGSNVMFHDDLTGEGRTLLYAVVDCRDNCVKISRGDVPFTRSDYTLGNYIFDLVESQGATLVAERGDAEVVLSVGRSEDEDAICLVDEGFFL